MFSIIDLDNKIGSNVYILGVKTEQEVCYFECWINSDNRIFKILTVSKNRNLIKFFNYKDLVKLMQKAIRNEINIQKHIDTQSK